ITNKIKKAFCIDKVIENNGLLLLCKYVIFKINKFKNKKLVIENKITSKNYILNNYEELEKLFENGNIASFDLKLFIINELDDIICNIRNVILNDESNLYKLAYPENNNTNNNNISNELSFDDLNIEVHKIIE